MIDPLLDHFNDVRAKIDRVEVINHKTFWLNITVSIWAEDDDEEFEVKARVDSVNGTTLCKIQSNPVEDMHVDLAVNACAARLVREQSALLHY